MRSNSIFTYNLSISVEKETNTYLKGDLLEAKAFEVFKKLIEDDRFYVSGKYSKIFRKKKYYSKDREANIIFDLSIETTMPDSNAFSLLTLLECKNYGSSVQVLDVEAFSDRVRQVGGHKGIMITTSKFQKSALKIAQTRNIAIARIFDTNELEWINRRIDEHNLSGKKKDFEDLIEMDNSINSAILGTDEGYDFTSFQDLFTYLGIIDQYFPSLSELKIPFKDDTLIEKRIKELGVETCYDHFTLSIDRLCIHMSELFDANFIFNEPFDSQSPSITLGKITYDPLTIYINPLLRGEPARWRFTIAHEIGHLVFHSHILKEYFTDITDNENSGILSSGISKEILQRMEIQANRFAAVTLMPTNYFLNVVKQYFSRESIYKTFLFFDHQPQNQKLVLTLLSELEKIFGVSKEAAKVRLKDLGLLKDAQDHSVNSHLRKMGY